MVFSGVVSALRRLGRARDGAALVEAALALVVLSPMLVGVTEFGLYMYEWSEVNRLVEAGLFFVTKNSDQLYAADPFDTSRITTAVGVDRYGDALTVTVGCSCSTTSGSGISLTPFQASPNAKCSQTLQCNTGKTPMYPYVLLKASHPHTVGPNFWNIPAASAAALIRIQ
jgi:Flp pilus assembly protein TadG